MQFLSIVWSFHNMNDKLRTHATGLKLNIRVYRSVISYISAKFHLLTLITHLALHCKPLHQ